MNSLPVGAMETCICTGLTVRDVDALVRRDSPAPNLRIWDIAPDALLIVLAMVLERSEIEGRQLAFQSKPYARPALQAIPRR